MLTVDAIQLWDRAHIQKSRRRLILSLVICVNVFKSGNVMLINILALLCIEAELCFDRPVFCWRRKWTTWELWTDNRQSQCSGIPSSGRCNSSNRVIFSSFDKVNAWGAADMTQNCWTRTNMQARQSCSRFECNGHMWARRSVAGLLDYCEGWGVQDHSPLNRLGTTNLSVVNIWFSFCSILKCALNNGFQGLFPWCALGMCTALLTLWPFCNRSWTRHPRRFKTNFGLMKHFQIQPISLCPVRNFQEARGTS